MNKSELEALVTGANEYLTNEGQNRIVGAAANPRFELYHSAPSLCSHKVRTVLAEKSIPYISHDMSIMPYGGQIPQNYRPGYVRLRIQGDPNAHFAEGYTGQSSVTTEGFDPCVVPTLVDHEKCVVVIDSSRICDYLDQETSESGMLIPTDLEQAISDQVDIIDQAPHVAILYGANPAGDSRPKGVQERITGIQDAKIVTLEAMIAEVPDDETLLAAYRSKISKESSSGNFVNDEASMREAYTAMEAHAEALETQLQTHSSDWALGNEFTMADIMWTVSLYRLKWLGLGHCWEDGSRPKVQEYFLRAIARPSFREAVLEWPGSYAPSPHVADIEAA